MCGGRHAGVDTSKDDGNVVHEMGRVQHLGLWICSYDFICFLRAPTNCFCICHYPSLCIPHCSDYICDIVSRFTPVVGGMRNSELLGWGRLAGGRIIGPLAIGCMFTQLGISDTFAALLIVATAIAIWMIGAICLRRPGNSRMDSDAPDLA